MSNAPDRIQTANGQQLILDELPIGRRNCPWARQSARGLSGPQLSDPTFKDIFDFRFLIWGNREALESGD